MSAPSSKSTSLTTWWLVITCLIVLRPVFAMMVSSALGLMSVSVMLSQVAGPWWLSRSFHRSATQIGQCSRTCLRDVGSLLHGQQGAGKRGDPSFLLVKHRRRAMAPEEFPGWLILPQKGSSGTACFWLSSVPTGSVVVWLIPT